MGEYNLDDDYVYYYGQESLRRNGIAFIVNKRVQNAVLECNLKNNRKICVRSQGKPYNTIVIQVCAPITNAEEAELEWFSEDLKDLLELTPPKNVLFITGEENAKVVSLRVTWNNRQVFLALAEQKEAGQRLTRVL